MDADSRSSGGFVCLGGLEQIQKALVQCISQGDVGGVTFTPTIEHDS